jgi:hypothetical protein
VYLEPATAFAVAKRLADETGEPITLGLKTMHKRLHERGMLASTEKLHGTLTVRRVLEGKRHSVLHISASLLGAGSAQSAHQSSILPNAFPSGQVTRAGSVPPAPEPAHTTLQSEDDTGVVGRIGQILEDDDIPF